VEYQERTAKGIIMDARFSYYGNRVAAKFTKYLNSAGAVVSNSAGGVTDEASGPASRGDHCYPRGGRRACGVAVSGRPCWSTRSSRARRTHPYAPR